MRLIDQRTNASDQLPTTYRQYRAPKTHGQTLVEPAFADVDALLSQNAATADSHGSYWNELRQRARQTMIDDAIRYTSSYRNVDWVNRDSDGPILMAGHQPSLFHAGVWFKNFALDHLAKRVGGLAINLVIDNDVAAGSSIRVPSLDGDGNPRLQVVPYDEAGGGVPYEQTTVRRRDLFDSFDVSVTAALDGVVENPSVVPLWRHAKAAIERCGVAGCALAQARHGLEGDLGLRTLELPLGVLCRTTVFAEFVLSILTELPRFSQCYNDAADGYRLSHGIRSSAHPVPNLSADDDWFEAPLWIYGNDSPQRKAAWCKLSGDELILSDRATRELRIDVRHPRLAAEQLANLVSPNFKLRPRALVTTMYARLVLSNLFLHGIGGGKYDQLGDQICKAFFGIDPLRFMVISATVQLPGLQVVDYASKIRELRRQLRDLTYQPERFADRVNLNDALLQRKATLISAGKPDGAAKAWHDELAAINQSLSTSLGSVRQGLLDQLAHARTLDASQRLMASREHPFCVYPVDYLTETFGKLLPIAD